MQKEGIIVCRGVLSKSVHKACFTRDMFPVLNILGKRGSSQSGAPYGKDLIRVPVELGLVGGISLDSTTMVQIDEGYHAPVNIC